MALGDPYATLDELKGRLDVKVADTLDDTELDAARDSVSRDIESWCERQFNDAGAASARRYRPLTGDLALVDDFHSTTGLIVETSIDGSTWEMWDATDYELEPIDGIVGGQPGWPFWRIVAVGSRRFPCARRTTVRVTAQWGWAAVPGPVKEACLLLAGESFKLPDAPFGVVGFGEFGAVRVRDNPFAQRKLVPYRLHPVLVA